MKKTFLIIIAFAFSGAVIAQEKSNEKVQPTAKPASEQAQPVKSDAGVKEESMQHGEGVTHMKHNKYECPKCHMGAEKPGKCSHCKVEMIEAKAEMKKEKAEMKEQKHGEGDGHNHGKEKEQK